MCQDILVKKTYIANEGATKTNQVASRIQIRKSCLQ